MLFTVLKLTERSTGDASNIGGMKLTSFLGRILIKVGRNTLTSLTS